MMIIINKSNERLGNNILTQDNEKSKLTFYLQIIRQNKIIENINMSIKVLILLSYHKYSVRKMNK